MSGNRYYVYALFRKDGAPFYIGASGSGRRFLVHLNSARSQLAAGLQVEKNSVIMSMRAEGAAPGFRVLKDGLTKEDDRRTHQQQRAYKRISYYTRLEAQTGAGKARCRASDQTAGSALSQDGECAEARRQALEQAGVEFSADGCGVRLK